MSTYRANEIKCAMASQMPDPSAVSVKPTGVQVQGSSDWLYRTFLQYDLSGIPDDARIISAKMYVYCSFHNDNGAVGTTNIARVTSEWSEETLCWNKMPSWTGRYLAEDVHAPDIGSWGEWDVTALVKEWAGEEKKCPNYGLYIINNNEFNPNRYNWGLVTHYRDLKESDDGDDSNNLGTYILITYDDPSDRIRFEIEESTLVAIADETRRLSGTTSKMTPLEIIEALNGVTTGGGLENGYDVTFYDENDEELAFFSIKEGASMNPPNYIVKAWQTEDGQAVQFPYTPTEDVILYANNDTLAKVLYDHFKVDMNEYPYLVLHYDGDNVNGYRNIGIEVYFAKSVEYNDPYISLRNSRRAYTSAYTTSQWNIDSTEEFVIQITQRLSAGSLAAETSNNSCKYVEGAYSDPRVLWINFDCPLTTSTIRQLDPKEEAPSYEGLADGYDVVFYNGDNEELAFYSVKEGYSINPPVYSVAKSWHAVSDGTTINFPYKPTSDIAIYANDSTWAKTLYDHFKIDMNEYPYVAIFYYEATSANWLQIWFGEKLHTNNSSGVAFNGKIAYLGDTAISKVSPLNSENMVNRLIELNPTLDYDTFTSGKAPSIHGDFVGFANFAIERSLKAKYRLDS